MGCFKNIAWLMWSWKCNNCDYLRLGTSIMGTVEPFCLKRLNEEDSWTLFSRRAFGTCQLDSSKLVEIGKKIVYKCHGGPLALKSMGGLMSTKHEIRDWLAILKAILGMRKTKYGQH
uniref:Uncharacterized protein n=1 Tax=Arundo donax TaxID=35708 RepID=A0A0A9HYZ8_ARUDO